jgi:hypothetical protein
MADECNAVRKVAGEGIRIISPLSDTREVLSFYQVDFRFGQGWTDHPVGEDGPCRIEHFGAGPYAEHRPVSTRRNHYLAPQPRHRTAQCVLGIALGSALRDVEQDRLDPRVGLRYLTRAAQQIEIRGNDVVGVVLSQDDVHAGHVEAGSDRRQRQCD